MVTILYVNCHETWGDIELIIAYKHINNKTEHFSSWTFQLTKVHRPKHLALLYAMISSTTPSFIQHELSNDPRSL